MRQVEHTTSQPLGAHQSLRALIACLPLLLQRAAKAKAKAKDGEKYVEQWSCVMTEKGVYALWLFLDADVMAGWPRLLNVSAAKDSKVRQRLELFNSTQIHDDQSPGERHAPNGGCMGAATSFDREKPDRKG